MMKASHNEGDLARLWQRDGADWRSAVQAYVAENPEARAIDIAAVLGCTEGEALSALSDAVWEIPGADLPQLLTEIRAWGPVLVLVRNGDAIAEVEVPGDTGYVHGDWLNWIDEGINLHIRIAATRQILALVRTGKRGPTHSFNLVNQSGQVFCRFYTRTPAARARFLTFCQAYMPKARGS
jgi:putative heme iron utilization protein